MPELHDTRERLLIKALERIAQNGSDLPGLDDGPGGRLRALVRRAALRLARPATARHEAFDGRLVTAVEALGFASTISQRAASSFPDVLAPGLVTDVPTQVGRLYLHAGDRVMTPMIRQSGVWEVAESAFLRRRLGPGATFVDVGATVGYCSVLASKLVGPTGRVIAVEPEPANLRLLKANLWRNAAGNAVVLPIAAHRRADFVALREGPTNRGDRQIGWADAATSLVPCARLDDLLAGQEVNVIKIDTPGTDHDVVAGLTGLLNGPCPPEIICEFWLTGMEQRGIDPRQVAGVYMELGLSLALLDADGESHPTSVPDLLEAAEDGGTRVVNVVLRKARG